MVFIKNVQVKVKEIKEDGVKQKATARTTFPGGGGRGGALPIMDYTGRLRPKGVPVLGWR